MRWTTSAASGLGRPARSRDVPDGPGREGVPEDSRTERCTDVAQAHRESDLDPSVHATDDPAGSPLRPHHVDRI